MSLRIIESMPKPFIFFLVSFLSLTWGTVFGSQDQISSREKASHLLFYLASNDVTMGIAQLRSIIGRTDTAASGLFKRLYEKEMERLLKNKRLKKAMTEEPKVFIFRAWDVRKAALEEFQALGDDALPVLRRSIHSARQDLILGVLRALKELDAKDILPILSDVLERDQDGRTRFSTRVRREAIIGLQNQDPKAERWTKLLEDNVVDIDPGARGLAQETVAMAMEVSPEWAVQQLERSVDHELALLEAYKAKALAWDNLRDFKDDPSRFSSVLRILETVLENAPQVYPETLPEVLQSSDAILRLSLLHHQKLNKKVRQEILHLALPSPNSMVALDAIRALDDSDREVFSSLVLEKLFLKTDPAVLSESIRLSGDWGLKEGRASLEAIAAKARRPRVKALAEETLKGF